METSLLLWIVLFPLAGAIANGLFGRFAERSTVTALGVGSVVLSFGIAAMSFVQLAGMEGDQALVQQVYEWFSISLGQSEVPIQVRFVMDSLSGVMTLVVTGVGLLIHIYSIGYMEHDPGYARFFAYLNLFMASMLILVLASNVPLMFVGWEGVGLCSYLLIGFWWEHTDFAKAGRKAFVMNRIGDFGVLIAMFILVTSVQSFEFSAMNGAAARLAATEWSVGTWAGGSIATAACLFLFLGCTGKSAQIPLYTWLPDAMAGPTPVSALIHAATMVTAGVYLCCRLSGLFLASSTAMAVIAVIGALTALVAASIAMVQNHMKKILAYSTVSQLGFMFAAVGSGAFAAGIFHVYTHAFFKACLFLGAGSVMHAVGEHQDADIRKLGGLGKYLPHTRWTFLLSCLAIAGVPLFSGFFSKDMILLGAAKVAGTPYYGEGAGWIGWLVFGLLVLAAIMTAFYMFRLYYRTFSGEYRSAEGSPEDSHPYETEPHESPKVMTVPLMVLGVGALVAGYVNADALVSWFGVHADLWGEWLTPVVAGLDANVLGAAVQTPEQVLEHAGHVAHLAAGAGGVLAMLIGIGAATALYRGRATDPLPQGMPRGLYQLLMDKWRVDELYDATVVRGIQKLALFSGWVDKTFVDGLLTKATSGSMRALGWVTTRAQTGVVYAYGAVMVVGVAVVSWWFLYPHIDVEGEVHGSQVSWEVAPGLGYEYRWDVNSDGQYESGWSSQTRTMSHQYRPEDWRGYVLYVETGPPNQVHRMELEQGATKRIPTRWLGSRWRTKPGGGAPTVTFSSKGEIFVKPNAATLTEDDRVVTDTLTLQPGDEALLGRAGIKLGATVESTVQVRNAFGNTATETTEIGLYRPTTKAKGAAVALRERER